MKEHLRAEDLPGGWQLLPIKRVARLRAGDAITGERIHEAGEFPVYGGNGVRGFTDQYTHEGSYPLIGRQGALCGCVNFATGRFWASEHAVVAKPAKGVDARWLAALLAATNLNRYSESAAQPGLSVERIAQVRVPVPPADHQPAIAAFLDRKTAAIDALIAKKERLIELLQEKRQAVITSAIFGGMALGGIRLSDASLPIPSGWRVEPAWLHLRPVKEQGHPQLTLLSVYRDHGVIPKDSREDNHNRPGENLAVYQRVLVGDVVMNKMKAWQGSIAVSETEGIVSPDYQVLRPASRAFRSRFLHLLLRSAPYIAEYAARAYGVRPDQWRLMLDDFRMIPLVIPPAEAQEGIANKVQRVLERDADVVLKIQSQLERLREYRQTLISAAVTGKIDISVEEAA